MSISDTLAKYLELLEARDDNYPARRRLFGELENEEQELINACGMRCHAIVRLPPGTAPWCVRLLLVQLIKEHYA